MRKKCSFVFEERHDMHDSASCDFYVLWIGLRSGSGGVRTKNCANSGSGYAFSGRVGSGRKIRTRVQLWRGQTVTAIIMQLLG